MQRMREAYRYATRDVKINEDAIVHERIVDAVLDNEGRNFWACSQTRHVITGSLME